jgi:hypothetical protein
VDRFARPTPDELVQHHRFTVSDGHNIDSLTETTRRRVLNPKNPLRAAHRSGYAGRKAEHLFGLPAHVTRPPGLTAPGKADRSRHALGLLAPHMSDKQTLGRARANTAARSSSGSLGKFPARRARTISFSAAAASSQASCASLQDAIAPAIMDLSISPSSASRLAPPAGI